jgi:DNA-binding transcriptional LysR family regulator
MLAPDRPRRATPVLNPRQLEAFRLVMLRGSVTRAALELKISQPAVSRLVRDLEEQSGIKLFVRHGNHLAPTPEANLLLTEVERYAHGIQAVSNFAEELRSRRRGMLSVAALPAMAVGFLPRFVASFIAGRSLKNVHVNGMPSHLVIEAVASGRVEIGLAAYAAEGPGLRLEPLYSRAVLVVPQGHRLARRTVVRPEDLAGEKFVSLEEPSIFTATTETILANVLRETIVTTPLSGIACSLVAAGTGITLVDPFSASEFAGRGVAIVPFEPEVRIRTDIVTSAHRRLSTVSEEFIEAFRGHVADLVRVTSGGRQRRPATGAGTTSRA